MTDQLDPVRLKPVEQTALIVAALRAEETRRADPLFTDPYAERLAADVGPRLFDRMLQVMLPPGGTRTVPMTMDYFSIRTRYFDDLMLRAVHSGVRQVVLAPAGVDTRAFRLPWPPGVRYFEIDRPPVLAYKQQVLAGESPRVAHYHTIGTDLVTEQWEQQLLNSGYDPAEPAVWVVEGLFYYLPEPQLRRLLDRIAALTPPGSTIMADMIADASFRDAGMRPLLDVFADWGCPLVYGNDDPAPLFRHHGFTVRAVQPGEDETTAYGRWPDPVPPRTTTPVHRLFYLHGVRH